MRASFENIRLRPEESFACSHTRCRGFGGAWHFHPELELTLIVRGEGRRFVGDHIAPFVGGDLVLLGPNLPHCWHSYRLAAAGEADAEAVVAQFRAERLGAIVAAVPELRALGSLLPRAGRGLHFRGAAAAAAAVLLAGLADLAGAPRWLRLLEVLALLAENPRAAGELASLGYTPQLDELASHRIDRIHQYVLAHLGERLDLATAAGLAHMSPSAFCRYFRRHTGRTFSAFVNEMRIGHACRLLLDSDQDIGGIAAASGFRNLSHFHRQFQARMGKTPRAFRRHPGAR